MTLKIENFKLKINKACSTPVEKIYKIKYSQKEYFINLGSGTVQSHNSAGGQAIYDYFTGKNEQYQ